MLCAWVTLIAITGIVGYSGSIVLTMIVFAAGATLLSVFFSALQGVYVASLYRYATEGDVPSGFDGELLKQAFIPKAD
jgi:FtsH-binding integral membrane protein